ncbi:MAG: 50S ribosomal protein L25 [bacterium]
MKVEKRTENVRIVRKMNKVPGVLFGKAITPVPIQVDEKELHDTYRQYEKTQAFTVKLGKDSHQVYIKNLQIDITNRNHLLNVELLKVGKGDVIAAKIPLHIIGRDVIEQNGHIVQVVDNGIEVEFAVGQGVSRFDVDISHLKVNDVIHIRDIQMPPGIKLVDNPEKVLIHIAETRIIEAEPEEAEPIEATIPEVEESKPKSKEDGKR